MAIRSKLALWVLVAILVALAGGWIWGASGRRDLDRRLRETELRYQLAEARRLMLQARVDLYNVNFGDASRHLEAAKVPLRGAIARLGDLDRTQDTAGASEALARVEEAQRLAGGLDQTANARVAEGLKALEEIAGAQ